MYNIHFGQGVLQGGNNRKILCGLELLFVINFDVLPSTVVLFPHAIFPTSHPSRPVVSISKEVASPPLSKLEEERKVDWRRRGRERVLMLHGKKKAGREQGQRWKEYQLSYNFLLKFLSAKRRRGRGEWMR